jgi:hypothetical protein
LILGAKLRQKRVGENTLNGAFAYHDYGISAFFSISRRDFDFVTSHTPEKTRITAMPCGHVKTPMPVSSETVTETRGCT